VPSAVRLEERTALSEPLMLCWSEPHSPLPVRAIRAPSRRPAPMMDAPPWLATGPLERPFDFCAQVQRLCADIVARCPALGHIDVSRLLFAVTQARTPRSFGLQARVTPLRFRSGSLTRRRRGTVFQVQRFLGGAREMLYLMTFCLPRFLDLTFDEKFVTIFHELYHIGPDFDGDLRRHGGRYAIHSHSQRLYDQQMAAMARDYLSGGPDPDLHAFLRLDFVQLQDRHGGVIGVVVPRPRLIPLSVD